jgi:hypothetical protein
MSDTNIGRYAKLLREGRPYDAWMLMLDDVEKAGDPDVAERLIDALAAAQWAVAAEHDPADELPEAAPVKVSLVKPRQVKAPLHKRRRHLRVVGHY